MQAGPGAHSCCGGDVRVLRRRLSWGTELLRQQRAAAEPSRLLVAAPTNQSVGGLMRSAGSALKGGETSRQPRGRAFAQLRGALSSSSSGIPSGSLTAPSAEASGSSPERRACDVQLNTSAQ
jgi:xanthine/CO dehydrogenase XdhC/CoxF family maturation factor